MTDPAALPDPLDTLDALLAWAPGDAPVAVPRPLLQALRDRAAATVGHALDPGRLYSLSEAGRLLARDGKPRSPSALRADIHAGRFGPKGEDGGPRLERSAWMIPGAAILRVLAPTSPSHSDSERDTSPVTVTGEAGVHPITSARSGSLVARRRHRQSSRRTA